MQSDDTPDAAYFCDMQALTPVQRERHGELATQLRPQVDRFIELPDGYSALFKRSLDDELTEFCALETLCCPFFSLVISQEEGVSRLTISGPGDIKPFIRSEFGIG